VLALYQLSHPLPLLHIDQTTLCRQDCILEYRNLLHDEWRMKKYLQETTSGWGLDAMFTDLEPWQGTSNIDFSWLDEDLPDNWEYRREIEKLKNSLAELISTTRKINGVKVQREIDEMLRIPRNKSTP
jgi:hypothetical protein